ncbi:MAG: dienelactone hydrolase family protein [Deltaproteobacteria bacterium]|nr:dienelactone hydrolase family protein [Deltaproteobacteria bacterium]
MRTLRSIVPLACAALLGCGDDALQAQAPPPFQPPLPATDPEARGPYAVGVTTMDTDDGEGTGRLLPIEIWYPAAAPAGASPASYDLMIGLVKLATMASPLGAVRDAPLDWRGAPHPVVVFSHGFGGTRFQSLYLTEHLASHGFVVAAPDHVGNTFAEQVNTANAIPAIEAARLRPGDVSRTLDALLARAAAWPGDPLAYAADPARVGVAGHSFGGFTALRMAGASIDAAAATETCKENPGLPLCEGWGEVELPASARDERFRASLPQAPGGSEAFSGGGLGDVAVPVMIQAGTSDGMTPYPTEAAAPYAALPPPAYLLTIEQAGHFTFSNMCALIAELGLSGEEFQDGCSPDNVPAAQAHAIIDRYATAFFQLAVAGDDAFAAELDPASAPVGASLQAK